LLSIQQGEPKSPTKILPPIMEILLLEDITGIGKKNDLLVVGDGFALNYLLPNRKALVATPTVRRRYAEQIRRRAEEKERDRQVVMQTASALAGKSITLARKTAKNGKLYEGIKEEDIAKALLDQLAVSVGVEAINLPEHIKVAGNHSVSIRMGDSSVTVPVVVQAQK
jgi:large subunit ribosomal protein L9